MKKRVSGTCSTLQYRQFLAGDLGRTSTWYVRNLLWPRLLDVKFQSFRHEQRQESIRRSVPSRLKRVSLGDWSVPYLYQSFDPSENLSTRRTLWVLLVLGHKPSFTNLQFLVQTPSHPTLVSSLIPFVAVTPFHIPLRSTTPSLFLTTQILLPQCLVTVPYSVLPTGCTEEWKVLTDSRVDIVGQDVFPWRVARRVERGPSFHDPDERTVTWKVLD